MRYSYTLFDFDSGHSWHQGLMISAPRVPGSLFDDSYDLKIPYTMF